MVLRQGGSRLSWFCLNISIELMIDSIFGQMRFDLLLSFGDRSSYWCFWLGFSELLLNFQVRIDGVHAEVEIGAVLLVILRANMRTSFFSGSKNVGRSTTLNGHDDNSS